MRCLFGILFVFPLGLHGISQDLPLSIAKYSVEAHEKWDAEVRKLEALDASEHGTADSILLLGSSSIRLWETAAEDLAPYHVIRRGYGGARYCDLAVFVKRLMKAHQFRAALVFVGNDVTGGDADKTPEEIISLVGNIRQALRTHQPDADVFLVEITPTEKRFHVWKEIRAVNVALREFCLTTSRTHFIPTAEYYLTPERQPRAELFRADRLHQNADGYKLWSRLIKRNLDEILVDRSL
jgi:hypothetical protein